LYQEGKGSIPSDRFTDISSNSKDRGFDFIIDLPANVAVYYGRNWRDTKTITSQYMTDYNADGIKDLVVENGGSQIVKFGKLKSNGVIEYHTSSESTVSPVIMGVPPTPNTDEEVLKDMKIVRIWEAPFEGTIDIDGTFSLDAASDEGVSVGIQKNGQFIRNMSPNTGGISLSTPVNKGDLLLFRARSKSNGFGDLARWNPQINYQGTSRTDANGIDYTFTTYTDAFMLSALESVPFMGDQALRVSWDNFNVNSPSDDVTFKIHLRVGDPVSGS